MTDNELIKTNEIIEALECCGNQRWFCPDRRCRAKTLGDAIDLIKYQKAEIEKLRNQQALGVLSMQSFYKSLQVEAIKVFAKEVKELNKVYCANTQDSIEMNFVIDNLVRKMTGGE